MNRVGVVLSIVSSLVVYAQARPPLKSGPPPARPTQSADAPPPASPPVAAPADEPPPPPPRPPPSEEPAPAAAGGEESGPPAPRLLRFGAGLSGGAVPAYYGVAWGFGLEGGVSLNFGPRFSLRLLANYTHTENGPYSTNLVGALVEPTVWFGVYGLGAAAIVGAADISRQGLGGALGAFASPVKLRFGSGVTHELSLDLGAVLITSDPNGVSGFGRLAYDVYF